MDKELLLRRLKEIAKEFKYGSDNENSDLGSQYAYEMALNTIEELIDEVKNGTPL